MMSVFSRMPICTTGVLFLCSLAPLQAFSDETSLTGNSRIKSLAPALASEIAGVFESLATPSIGDEGLTALTGDGGTSLQRQVDQWIEQLGSTQFAQRERATAGLRAAGREALGALKDAALNYEDIEVRTRAADVAQGIIQGETAGRIDAFLAGDNEGLEGWPIAQRILGDGLRVRELYVDLVMRHEDVAQALMGTSSDRAKALRSAIVRVQRGMFVEQRLPTEADAIALLMMVNDRNIRVGAVEEGALFSVLNKEASALLLKDPQLSHTFRQLLGGWMTRSDVSNRTEMLWKAMEWDLHEATPLAIETLEQSENPFTLGMAAQAISKFGEASDIAKLQPLLDDERAAADQQFGGGTVSQTQVRDAAMAAIILIGRRKLSDFGFDDNAFHPRCGFIIQDVGFPIDDPKPREAALEKVKSELLGETIKGTDTTKNEQVKDVQAEDD